MKYVFSGQALDKVLLENRIRIARGELVVTPLVEAEAVEDVKDVPADTKEVQVEDKKKPVSKKKSKK